MFCTEILPVVAEDESSKEWAAAVLVPAEDERRLAHDAVRQEFGRPALTGLVLAMAAWAEPDSSDGRRSDDSQHLQRPVGKLLPGLLDHLARRVEKRGGRLRRRSAEDLQGLRKALKKLRYSVEFVSGLYPAKQARQYSKPVTRLLKLLGAANDAQVASSLAESLGTPDRRKLGPAVDGLKKWSAHRATQSRRKLPKAWDAFAAESPVWR